VVARLVVEIRSDGTRTIARGALQDATLGQEVAIQAEGTTPLALAASLVRSMLKAPFLPWGRAFGGALKALRQAVAASDQVDSGRTARTTKLLARSRAAMRLSRSGSTWRAR
jgi:hypothetical protein